jgi:Na+-transporting methylmalonyl-CoA/oxaloacetate decarboxylase gamma subunit
MAISESLLVAIFCMAMVFFVLFCLCLLIKLFSFAIRFVSSKK